VIFDTKALAVRLSPERLMFLDPAWYAFSDPVLRRDTGIMGLGSLTFDLDLVRKT
jgi:hypothetical protein